MAATSRFALVDQLLGGKLAETLAGLKSNGLTYDQMAQHFGESLGIPASRETLRRWLKQIDAKEPAA